MTLKYLLVLLPTGLPTHLLSGCSLRCNSNLCFLADNQLFCCKCSAVPFIMVLIFRCLTQARSKRTVSQSYCLPYSLISLPLSLISPFPPLRFNLIISSLLSGDLGCSRYMSSCAGRTWRTFLQLYHILRSAIQFHERRQ